jgi:hypothetical protein
MGFSYFEKPIFGDCSGEYGILSDRVEPVVRYNDISSGAYLIPDAKQRSFELWTITFTLTLFV